MAIYSGFYNSVVGDPRTYHNTDFSRLMSLLINDGVFQNFGKQFIVKPGRGMQVIVQPGKGWFNERWLLNDSDLPITIEAAPIVANYKRIDTIAIKIDDSLDVRDGKILCIQGTPSEVPSPPRLVDSEDVHYHKLADILVGANVTSIIAANITNYVGTTTTPFITGILKTIDMTTLINQWHDQFERWNSAEQQAFLNWATNEQNAFIDWFNRMKDQLTEDAAGRLQTEVDDVRGQIHTNLLNSALEDSTVGEVTCTSNGDGTYTFNGTTTTVRNFFPLPVGQGYEVKKDVTYRLSGCPSGGSSTKYALIAEGELGTAYKKTYAYDYGNGVSFTVPTADIDAGYRLRITISIRSNVENLVFKPMLTTDLSATYDSFVKYSGSEERLNEQVAELHEKSKGLHTNLVPNNYHETTGLPEGITLTENGDGTYTLNGTATTSGFFIPYRGRDNHDKVIKDNKKYLLTNCQELPLGLTFHIGMRRANNSTVKDVLVPEGTTSIVFDTNNLSDEWEHSIIYYNISSGKPFNNVVLKPMITEDLTAEKDFVPYSGDGRLNENVAALFDMFHPVGTLYESVNKDFNPNTARGWHGTWERIKDRFVYACGDSEDPGTLGGSNTHKITSSELPAHNHPIPALTGTAESNGLPRTVTGLSNTSYYTGFWNGGHSLGNQWPYNAPPELTAHTHSVKTNASNTSNNATYNTAIDIRPAFIRAYIWKRVS